MRQGKGKFREVIVGVEKTNYFLYSTTIGFSMTYEITVGNAHLVGSIVSDILTTQRTAQYYNYSLLDL